MPTSRNSNLSSKDLRELENYTWIGQKVKRQPNDSKVYYNGFLFDDGQDTFNVKCGDDLLIRNDCSKIPWVARCIEIYEHEISKQKCVKLLWYYRRHDLPPKIKLTHNIQKEELFLRVDCEEIQDVRTIGGTATVVFPNSAHSSRQNNLLLPTPKSPFICRFSFDSNSIQQIDLKGIENKYFPLQSPTTASSTAIQRKTTETTGSHKQVVPKRRTMQHIPAIKSDANHHSSNNIHTTVTKDELSTITQQFPPFSIETIDTEIPSIHHVFKRQLRSRSEGGQNQNRYTQPRGSGGIDFDRTRQENDDEVEHILSSSQSLTSYNRLFTASDQRINRNRIITDTISSRMYLPLSAMRNGSDAPMKIVYKEPRIGSMYQADIPIECYALRPPVLPAFASQAAASSSTYSKFQYQWGKYLKRTMKPLSFVELVCFCLSTYFRKINRNGTKLSITTNEQTNAPRPNITGLPHTLTQDAAGSCVVPPVEDVEERAVPCGQIRGSLSGQSLPISHPAAALVDAATGLLYFGRPEERRPSVESARLPAAVIESSFQAEELLALALKPEGVSAYTLTTDPQLLHPEQTPSSNPVSKVLFPLGVRSSQPDNTHLVAGGETIRPAPSETNDMTTGEAKPESDHQFKTDSDLNIKPGLVSFVNDESAITSSNHLQDAHLTEETATATAASPTPMAVEDEPVNEMDVTEVEMDLEVEVQMSNLSMPSNEADFGLMGDEEEHVLGCLWSPYGDATVTPSSHAIAEQREGSKRGPPGQTALREYLRRVRDLHPLPRLGDLVMVRTTASEFAKTYMSGDSTPSSKGPDTASSSIALDAPDASTADGQRTRYQLVTVIEFEWVERGDKDNQTLYYEVFDGVNFVKLSAEDIRYGDESDLEEIALNILSLLSFDFNKSLQLLSMAFERSAISIRRSQTSITGVTPKMLEDILRSISRHNMDLNMVCSKLAFKLGMKTLVNILNQYYLPFHSEEKVQQLFAIVGRSTYTWHSTMNSPDHSQIPMMSLAQLRGESSDPIEDFPDANEIYAEELQAFSSNSARDERMDAAVKIKGKHNKIVSPSEENFLESHGRGKRQNRGKKYDEDFIHFDGSDKISQWIAMSKIKAERQADRERPLPTKRSFTDRKVDHFLNQPFQGGEDGVGRDRYLKERRAKRRGRPRRKNGDSTLAADDSDAQSDRSDSSSICHICFCSQYTVANPEGKVEEKTTPPVVINGKAEEVEGKGEEGIEVAPETSDEVTKNLEEKSEIAVVANGTETAIEGGVTPLENAENAVAATASSIDSTEEKQQRVNAVLIYCDGCDSTYHLQCVGLTSTPEGDWFCASCNENASGVRADNYQGSKGTAKSSNPPKKRKRISNKYIPDSIPTVPLDAAAKEELVKKFSDVPKTSKQYRVLFGLDLMKWATLTLPEESCRQFITEFQSVLFDTSISTLDTTFFPLSSTILNDFPNFKEYVEKFLAFSVVEQSALI